ncbi:hypothetical protein EON81_24560 [bacterium]|nr:MAG: hypothetical protein EON81_24560 [bacterium]
MKLVAAFGFAFILVLLFDLFVFRDAPAYLNMLPLTLQDSLQAAVTSLGALASWVVLSKSRPRQNRAKITPGRDSGRINL